MTLYSYCIPVDDGAAPNPFWGVCTLAICKPAIRRIALPGDWIVGTGSTDLGFANKMVYAMKVREVMTFEQYDFYCKKSIEGKIPDTNNHDIRRRVGDCIYEYKNGIPKQRKSVHSKENQSRDLGGKNVLLSNHFYYFGSEPIDIPSELLNIVRQGPGFKSTFNNPYKDQFVKWINGMPSVKNKILAEPYGFSYHEENGGPGKCSKRHCSEDDEDEEIGNNNC